MTEVQDSKRFYVGITLAVLATIIWSGNFIVARGVVGIISPVSLAFYRWLTASLIMIPLAWKYFQREKVLITKHWRYFFWTALTGVTLFNTVVYIAGQYSPATNLALIGTTTSPVFSIILAAVFVGEKVSRYRIIGMIICAIGILFLLSQGSIERLIAFRFSAGDTWIIIGALFFAIYNILVRKKPMGISPLNFLFVTFSLGTILLLPFYIGDLFYAPTPTISSPMLAIILYLGLGTSVIAFLCWNASIERVGAATTAIIGNLIPVFAAIEAVIFLNETITRIHLISAAFVILGLVVANIGKKQKISKGIKEDILSTDGVKKII